MNFKKTAALTTFLLACLVSFGQKDSIPDRSRKTHKCDSIDHYKKDSLNPDTKLPINKPSDCAYKRVNGKMMQAVDEKMQAMTKSEVLSNGNIIMTDGSLKMKNGKTIILKEGDCIDRSGELHPSEQEPKSKGK